MKKIQKAYPTIMKAYVIVIVKHGDVNFARTTPGKVNWFAWLDL